MKRQKSSRYLAHSQLPSLALLMRQPTLIGNLPFSSQASGQLAN